jgi:hypothetical protein
MGTVGKLLPLMVSGGAIFASCFRAGLSFGLFFLSEVEGDVFLQNVG